MVILHKLNPEIFQYGTNITNPKRNKVTKQATTASITFYQDKKKVGIEPNSMT